MNGSKPSGVVGVNGNSGALYPCHPRNSWSKSFAACEQFRLLQCRELKSSPHSFHRIHPLRLAALLLLHFLSAWPACAHVGSPDVFYDGMVGPYPARITIRMPGVVPGRAEISVRVQAQAPVKVSFLPLYGRTSITNAPPPD